MKTELEKIKNDKNNTVRTQISLTPSLKIYVDRQAQNNNISMSAYIRKAIISLVEDTSANERIKTESVKNFIGSDEGKNEWGKTRQSVLDWQKQIRKDKY